MSMRSNPEQTFAYFKPGITGLWQVEMQVKLDFDEVVRLMCPRTWLTIWSDIKILLKTTAYLNEMERSRKFLLLSFPCKERWKASLYHYSKWDSAKYGGCPCWKLTEYQKDSNIQILCCLYAWNCQAWYHGRSVWAMEPFASTSMYPLPDRLRATAYCSGQQGYWIAMRTRTRGLLFFTF